MHPESRYKSTITQNKVMNTIKYCISLRKSLIPSSATRDFVQHTGDFIAVKMYLKL